MFVTQFLTMIASFSVIACIVSFLFTKEKKAVEEEKSDTAESPKTCMANSALEIMTEYQFKQTDDWFHDTWHAAAMLSRARKNLDKDADVVIEDEDVLEAIRLVPLYVKFKG